jgi:hypothetical protein
MRKPGKGLESQVKETLEGVLGQVPFVRLKRWRKAERAPEGARADLAAEVLAKGEPWRLLVEVTGRGEPRYVRSAVQQLRSALADSRKTYGIVSAPYISPDAGRICREEGMGYLDLAGNCGLSFADLFIERQAASRPAPERRPLRSLFAPRAGRVLRVLLERPKQTWTLKALSREAGVSLGLAFKVKERLLDLELVAAPGRKMSLARPEDLLRQWAANDPFARNRAVECYAQGAPAELEATLAASCRKSGAKYAFTLFSGAARVAPFARYLKGAAYVAGDPAELAKRLGWKEVSTGASFALLEPYDDGVFYGAREINGDSVVGDVQLYLDLAASKARGEDAAAFLLEQRLRPQW